MSIVPYLVGAFVGVVGVGLGIGGLRSQKKSKAIQAWPTVSGTLSSSEVVAHRSSGISSKGHSTTRVSHEAVVSYAYKVDGKEFKGRNIGIIETRGGKHAAERRIKALKSKPDLKVFYNPSDPKEAYLNPKNSESIGLFVIGAILFILGFLVLRNASLLNELFSF